MNAKLPKDDRKFSWTSHIKMKMAYYRLSEQRIRRVFRSPLRHEEGIAPGTIAAMQPAGTSKKTEIWLMYQPLGKGSVRMVSAWRYPGITKPGTPIPIPNEIQEELAALFQEKITGNSI